MQQSKLAFTLITNSLLTSTPSH